MQGSFFGWTPQKPCQACAPLENSTTPIDTGTCRCKTNCRFSRSARYNRNRELSRQGCASRGLLFLLLPCFSSVPPQKGSAEGICFWPVAPEVRIRLAGACKPLHSETLRTKSLESILCNKRSTLNQPVFKTLRKIRRGRGSHCGKAESPLAGDPAARQSPGADPRRISRLAGLQVVPDVPERTVIARVQGQRRVVLPAQCIRLRSLSISQHRLVQSQRARLIARQPRREPLPRKVRAVAEGVAHRDITLLVHAGTRHPAEATVRRIRPLLHQLVSLRVKTHPSSRLRSTLRQLPVAKVVIRSHRNLLRPLQVRTLRMLPVDEVTPRKQSIIFKLLMQLCPSSRQHDLRHTLRRQPLPVHIRGVEEGYAGG